VWLKHKPLSDYTFPALSIIRGQRVHNLTRATFANQHIEDLPIPYFAISCNLTDASQIVHDRGPLWQGVRASASLPGTGPPLFVDGQVLVDGGVINNLPVDVMRERHGGLVIAVDVGAQDTLTVDPDAEQTPSGWRILWHRLNPFARPLELPSIFEILYRTATLNSHRRSMISRALADLMICPQVQHVRTLDFRPFDAVIEAGYQATLRALRDSTDPRLAAYRQRLPAPDAVPEPRPQSLPRRSAATPRYSWRRLLSARTRLQPPLTPARAVVLAALLLSLSTLALFHAWSDTPDQTAAAGQRAEPEPPAGFNSQVSTDRPATTP
jgi:predicted acylesterase/phospholipase RssA